MTFAPLMWSVWSALVVIMAGLYVYRLALTRDEDTQVILDDSFERARRPSRRRSSPGSIALSRCLR